MTLTMIIAIIAAMLFGVFCALCLYAIFKNQKDVEKNENRMKGIENKLGSMTELINSRTEMLENKINEQPIYNVYSDMIDVNPSYPYDTPAEGTESAINISDLLSDDFEDLLVDEGDEAPEKSIEEDEVLSAFMNSFKAFEKEVIGSEASGMELDEKPIAPVVLEKPTAPVVLEEPIAPVVPEEPIAPVVLEEPVVKQVAEIQLPKETPQVQEQNVIQEQLDIFDEPEVQDELEVAEILKKSSWAIRPEKPEEKKIEETIEKKEDNPFKQHIGHDVGRSGKKYTASELEKLIRE